MDAALQPLNGCKALMAYCLWLMGQKTSQMYKKCQAGVQKMSGNG
jgi:hypothetical protein